MRIGVVTVQVPFVRGGAEVHAENLVRELGLRGHEAEIITVPFKWYPPQAILDSIVMARLIDLSESSGRPIDRIIGLKFPAYLIPHHSKVLWLLHQHRTAYELWDHPQFGDLVNFPEGKAVRDAIRFADKKFIPQSRAVFATSKRVAARLSDYCGIRAEPLYHPPNNPERYYTEEAEDYLFFPSRITRLKRHDLVIEALRQCRRPVRVVFAGATDDPVFGGELVKLVAQYGLTSRVVWKGFLGESEKLELYARCLGVVYPPIDEDYGYVTLEAMLSSKPVITVDDAGGPLEFVTNGGTGLIAMASAADLAMKMDELWGDRSRAKLLGRAGQVRYNSMGINWDLVVDKLTEG